MNPAAHQLSDAHFRSFLWPRCSCNGGRAARLNRLDEPELGPHPSALEILAGMARAASLHCQLRFATQSSVFLDYFQPENVVVVNTRAATSEF